MPNEDLPTIVIAMLTYLRPDDLRDAVPTIIDQMDDVPNAVELLIVDNDPDAGAMATAHEYGDERVRFVHEPTPGIAAARNRALDAAGSRLLVFIDDDERPEPGWLRSLVDTWASTTPCGVVGRVVSVYPSDPDPWIEAGGFFRRKRFKTGTQTMVAATNNLLLDLDQVRSTGVRFDMDFGLSGGSDTLFTCELSRAAGPMLWCDEAVVVDVVPVSRLSRDWVLRRVLRSGNGWSRVTLALTQGRAARALARVTLSAQGVIRIVGGSARYLLGTVTRSMSHRARGANTLFRGLGMFGGAWGLTYFEYRR